MTEPTIVNFGSTTVIQPSMEKFIKQLETLRFSFIGDSKLFLTQCNLSPEQSVNVFCVSGGFIGINSPMSLPTFVQRARGYNMYKVPLNILPFVAMHLRRTRFKSIVDSSVILPVEATAINYFDIVVRLTVAGKDINLEFIPPMELPHTQYFVFQRI